MDYLIELLKNNNCYINRGDKSCKELIQEKCLKYVQDIHEAIIPENNPLLGEAFCKRVQGEIFKIEKEILGIEYIYNLFDCGKIIDAYNMAYALFDDLESYMVCRLLNSSLDQVAFRIRNYDGKFDLIQKELFHIPFNKRYLVKDERYSLSGHPCLYLSTQVGLAWHECNCPKEFAISKYMLPNDDNNALRVVDFSMKLISEMHQIYCDICNYGLDKNIENRLLNIIVTYPLRLACSIPVENLNAIFKEEYIISQMLLQWVISKEFVDGIIYESCKVEARAYGGYNVVLPTKNIGNDGYDNILKKKLKMSKPQVVRAGTDENDFWELKINEVCKIKI